jgi:regulator of nonsense transcripts 2
MEPSQKIKPSDVAGLVSFCVEMHRRYDGFASVLIPSLMAGVTGTGSGDEENTLPKRLCLRVLTEFVLCGIITDLKSIVKIISEAAGAPSDGDREYVVTDANVVVTFAKTGGHEMLGVVPRALRTEYERLEKELTGKGEGKMEAVAVTDVDQSTVEQAATTDTVPETPFVPVLSNKLIERAQAVIDAYNSTTPHARAVSQSTCTTLHTHCLGAYRTLANSYLATHRKLLKLKKRCDQDRLLQGNLSEAREKGLSDARTLLDNLKKSVEVLSDVLDVDPPVLPSSDEDEDANAESGDGKGISLWTNENDTDENLGPFDDEETRAFYCDVPDLLATKPAALLGLNPVDFEKQRERNNRQYSGLGGGDEVVAMDVEDVETKDDDMDEVNEAHADDATMDENAEGETGDGGKICGDELSLNKLLYLILCFLPYYFSINFSEQGYSSL